MRRLTGWLDEQGHVAGLSSCLTPPLCHREAANEVVSQRQRVSAGHDRVTWPVVLVRRTRMCHLELHRRSASARTGWARHLNNNWLVPDTFGDESCVPGT